MAEWATDDEVQVVAGLADNGHSRYWASCRRCGHAGPFRASWPKADEDAQKHSPKCPQLPRWEVVEASGQLHVGLVLLGAVMEYVCGPSGPTRYGSIQSARNAARAANERMARA